MKQFKSNLEQIDLLRQTVSSSLDAGSKKSFSQFFTPSPIAHYMASLFTIPSARVNLLDPGAGNGTLGVAFGNELLRKKFSKTINIDYFEVDEGLIDPLKHTISQVNKSRQFSSKIINKDFIVEAVNMLQGRTLFDQELLPYTHAILNPPYGKIRSTHLYHKLLKSVGITTGNLYTAFVALAVLLLEDGGELVTIIPRSFTNGPYFLPFREFLLANSAIRHIHVFESRNRAFAEDGVLQENIIMHLTKGVTQGDVLISSSPGAQFELNGSNEPISFLDMKERIVSFQDIVHEKDKHKFIHIVADHSAHLIKHRMSGFSTNLENLNIQVSTGPVVDFRLKTYLRSKLNDGDAPLIYPKHIKTPISWPRTDVRANAIRINDDTRRWLYPNEGCYVLLKRFSSKEEKKRIVASIYKSDLPGEYVGFDNMLNVFHFRKAGLPEALAKGLYLYLNSSLFDGMFRHFSGHTQVNATDLRNMRYPDSVWSQTNSVHLI